MVQRTEHLMGKRTKQAIIIIAFLGSALLAGAVVA